MIKSNRIRNIFALTILLSPLFSSGAEELVNKKEKNSSKWNIILLSITESDPEGYVETTQNYFSRREGFSMGIFDDGDGNGTNGLGDLVFSGVAKIYRYSDSAEEDFEKKIKHCFKEVANCISTGTNYPGIVFFLKNKKNENHLYIANAGEYVTITRNNEIIFNSKNGNLLNPIIYTHFIEEGDVVLSLNRGFQGKDDVVLLDDACSIVLPAGCKKRAAIVMRFVKQTESEQ